MALTKYSYTKDINPDRLTKQITDSAIVAALNHINTLETAVDIWFDDALSSGDETILDGIVTAHVKKAHSSRGQYWEINPEAQTALQAWQTAMSRTSAPLRGLDFILSWYCELRLIPAGPVNSKAAMRFAVDGNVKGSAVTIETNYVAFSGWDRYRSDPEDEPVLTIQYRRDPAVGGNDTVAIRKMKIGIRRLG